MTSKTNPSHESAEERITRLEEELAAERKTRIEAERARGRVRDLAARQQAAIVQIARRSHTPAAAAGPDEVLRELTRVAALTLGVERASVWLLNADRTELRCAQLYELSKDAFSSGVVLSAASYPRYFAALESGRAIDAHDARTDPRTAEFRDGYLVPLGITSMMDAAIRLDGVVAGVVCHEHVGPSRTWSVDDVDFAGALADQAALELANADRRRLEGERQRTRRELAETWDLATRDPLTGLHNRREMERYLAEEISRAERNGQALSVAMIDLDHFKSVNDQHGHPVGDDVLRQLAQRVRENLRGADRCTRYGGEELFVVLPETEPDVAHRALERLRLEIAGQVFRVRLPDDDGAVIDLSITVSIGLASYPIDAQTVDALIRVADRAMYEAKQRGRNQTVRAAASHRKSSAKLKVSVE